MSSNLKSRTRADYPYSMSHQTRWSDNDQYGHINNAIYQHYFDTVINAYLIKFCGLDPLTSPSIGLAIATSSQYFRPLSFPQLLDLGLRVNKLGTSSVTYEIGVFLADPPLEGPAAVGTFTHVFVDTKSRKSVAMSYDLRAGLEKLLIATEEASSSSPGTKL